MVSRPSPPLDLMITAAKAGHLTDPGFRLDR